MDTTLNFEEVYKTSMFCLRLIGAHPSVVRDHKWALQFIIMYGLFATFAMHCFYNMIFINIKENDFPNACSNGVFMVVMVEVSFKYGVLFWHQKALQSVIEVQQQYFELSREFTTEEQAIVKNYIKKGQWITNVWFYSCLITAFLFPVKSFLDSAYSAYKGDFMLYSFTENSYPGLDKIKSRIDIYLLIYSTFFYYAFFSGSMYSGFAPLGPICIMNACAQMDIVTIRVNRLFDGKGFDEKETPEKLKKIIIFLQTIYSFVDQINDIFQVLYEVCLKASAILIPISLFLLIESARDGKLSLDYVMFSYLAFLLCFVPSYYSDKLKEKGEELHFALYACGWEKFYDKKTRVTLHIMMMRASKPLSIKTVFRAVCLETFSETLPTGDISTPTKNQLYSAKTDDDKFALRKFKVPAEQRSEFYGDEVAGKLLLL